MTDADGTAARTRRVAPSVGEAGAGAWSYAVAVAVPWVPIALFVIDNAAKIFRPWPLVVVGVVGSVVSAAVVAVVGRFRGRAAARATAAVIGAVVLVFFLFGRVFSVEPASAGATVVGIGVWLALTALVSVLAARLAAVPAARQFVAIVLVVILAVAIVNAGSTALARRDPPVLTGAAITDAGEPDARPDVYWFVLDEMAPTDELRRLTGYDNSWFDDALRERGFTVSSTSTSAYPHTHLSIASTLLMDYPFTDTADLGDEAPFEFDLVTPVISGRNPVVDRFHQLGYAFAFAPAGPFDWEVCDPASAEVCIAPESDAPWREDPVLGLLATTPLALVGAPPAHSTPEGVVDRLAADVPSDRPVFLFAHILSPHQPFRYEADCSTRSVWIDGERLSGAERAAAYAQDVRCLSHDVLEAVDRIVAADPDAIVIVQSDHGSKLSLDWSQPLDGWSDASLQERFSAVNAMRLPTTCDVDLDGANLVNTFRTVFTCIDGTAPDPLPSRNFFTGFEQLGTLQEVTGRVQGSG